VTDISSRGSHLRYPSLKKIYFQYSMLSLAGVAAKSLHFRLPLGVPYARGYKSELLVSRYEQGKSSRKRGNQAKRIDRSTPDDYEHEGTMHAVAADPCKLLQEDEI
jgi:hypothetical protein